MELVEEKMRKRMSGEKVYKEKEGHTSNPTASTTLEKKTNRPTKKVLLEQKKKSHSTFPPNEIVCIC